MRAPVAVGLALLGGGLASAEAPAWLKPPQLAVMTGFIKDPPSPQAIEDWQQGLGAQFDAGAWVRGFKEAGAGYLIFYDKWIDGLVFHDTQTTGYRTKRDFLREVADACHAQGLPLVIYWNAAYDDNPEFAQYATLDQDGKPIRFPDPWPSRLLSMHSPFREKAQEQVREILTGYGPIAGLWLDCYSQPWPTTDPYTSQAFQARHHKPPAEATPEEAAEFVQATLVDYLRDLRAFAAETGREARPTRTEEVAFTYNGSHAGPMGSPSYASRLAAPLGFLSNEGHSLPAMDSQAMAASFLKRPMETGDLVSATWFSPPPPMAADRARQALAEAAVAWCQGANVYFALTPTYEGAFGEELAAVQGAGRWLEARRALLAESTPWPDIGIVLGAPAAEMPAFPALSQLWGLPVKGDVGASGEAQRLCRTFSDLGYGTQILYALGDLAAWPERLSPFRLLVLPERACLDAQHLARVNEYVRDGGHLLAFGHASLRDASGKPQTDFALADVLGVSYRGEAKPLLEAQPAVCYADSDYSAEWGRDNLTDGTAAGWASAATPMPHWAQVNLPVEQPVATVRVVGRQGPYMLRDFDVLTWTGTGWESVRRFTDNNERLVECPIGPPRMTLGVRVVVNAETLDGQERMLADIEEIELLGANGKLLSRPPSYVLSITSRSGTGGLYVTRREAPGPAVIAEVHAASPLATFTDPSDGRQHPFATMSSFGRGKAFWVAAGEASLAREADWWPLLGDLAAGPAGLSWDTVDRHRVILRRSGEALLICAIDTQPDQPPEKLSLHLRPDVMGLGGTVDPVADGPSVTVTDEGNARVLTITPDPAVTVLVR